VTKQTLAEWLTELREDDEIAASQRFYGDEYDEDDDDSGEGRVVWSFPSDESLDEFVTTIDGRSQDEVDLVLRHLLIPSCLLEKDYQELEAYLERKQRDDPGSKKFVERMEHRPHFQRVLAYCTGATKELPWEGIRWVLQLLPDHPATALAAIDAYFIAHMWDMADSLIHAMADAEAVIRARYIGVPETQEERRQTLYDLSPRQFEVLVQQLYQALGYEAELTPSTRDRGRDVIARRTQAGRAEHVLLNASAMLTISTLCTCARFLALS
jgi:restriction system protein